MIASILLSLGIPRGWRIESLEPEVSGPKEAAPLSKAESAAAWKELLREDVSAHEEANAPKSCSVAYHTASKSKGGKTLALCICAKVRTTARRHHR